MGRRGDSTGVDQTCPLINKVIHFLDSLSQFDMPDGYAEDQKQMEETLEKIRSMNSDLRDFGNKHYDELQEVEKDRDYYEKRCKDLEHEVSSLQDDIRQLETQLA